MRHRLIAATTLLILALWAGVAQAQLQIEAHGFYCSTFAERQAIPTPDTEGDRIWHSETVRLPEIASRRVPARLGITFGVVVTSSLANVPVDVEVSHPPLGETGRTRQSWNTQPIPRGGSNGIGYTFDMPAELAPGIWTFTLRQRGKPLLTEQFIVVEGSEADALARLCTGAVTS